MDRGRPPRDDLLPKPPPGSTFAAAPPPSSARPKTGPGPKVKIEPVRRKPVPSSASSSPATPQKPLAPIWTGSKVNGGQANGHGVHQSYQFDQPPIPQPATPAIVPRDLDQYPRGFSPRSSQPSGALLPPITVTATAPSRPRPRQASESVAHDATNIKGAPVKEGLQRAMSSRPLGRPSNEHEPTDPSMITKTPRSPGPNKLTSFFGWKTSSPVAEVSPATYSEGSHSPGPSPLSPSPQPYLPATKSIPNAINVPKANATMDTSFFEDTGFPVPPHYGGYSPQSDDMEEELREVSSELAGSIRRELELEDLVERLQAEVAQGPDLAGRRTSDYFSDSGSGSFRYPVSEAGANKVEDLAKQKRISEQEKAQFKLNLSQKLQDERGRRKALEAQVHQFGEQMQNMKDEREVSSGVASRVRELESSLDDHRRRLQEERRLKENFEDLLAALKGEIAEDRAERDNLRDEVVPQLQSRVEGLESEAAEHENFVYDSARELQSLKNENTTLMNARRLQLEMQQHSSRFNAIAEEEEQSPTAGLGLGLGKSPSLARAAGQGGLSRSPSLKRSNSISNKEWEFNERVKDIEMQRDALHRALKSLLERQNFQNREHEKRIQALELERDRALQNQSPRRMGYEKEVTGLRYEINQLRRRADEAIQQKYQCEKGLGGLKKDLDRAEQETTSLRALLQEHDILVPERPGSRSKEVEVGSHATSASLEKAYRELQRTQAVSITKLRELHGGLPSSSDDAETAATMDMLLKSMSDAEAERDFAQKQAAIFRAEAESLKAAESFHDGENAGLGDQLRASANRVEALSTQVRTQLGANSSLRQRLAEAVGRGEQEQKNSTTRINSMQGKLKALEDKLMTAQQQSEEAFAEHEEEVRDIQESHNRQLQRLKNGLKTASVFGSTKGSPMMSPIFTARSPRLDRTTSGIGMSLDTVMRTEFLEKRVAELESALGEADKEMEEVVGRMNLAQIEVMELQSARDEAMRQTRKLQAAIIAEREKVASLMK